MEYPVVVTGLAVPTFALAKEPEAEPEFNVTFAASPANTPLNAGDPPNVAVAVPSYSLLATVAPVMVRAFAVIVALAGL